METLIAGWVAGYSMAILTTVALTYIVAQARSLEVVQRVIPEGASPLLIAVPVSLGAFLGWTLLGLILGAIYEVGDLGARQGALGSPSAPFLLVAAALALLPLPVLVMLWRRRWWLWGGMSLAFLGLFGWAMPLLAER